MVKFFLVSIDKTNNLMYTFFVGFEKKLKNNRENRQETLHKAAMGTDIDSTLLSKFERGKRFPTDKQIQRLAGHYNLDKNQLAVEVIAGKILTKYGYTDLTYGVAMFVQEEMKKYYANGEAGGKND